jgi:hypothetical protein
MNNLIGVEVRQYRCNFSFIGCGNIEKPTRDGLYFINEFKD